MSADISQPPCTYWEVYALVSRAVARSVAACLPLTLTHVSQEVAVKVRVHFEPLLVTTVSGTLLISSFVEHRTIMQHCLTGDFGMAVGDSGLPIADLLEARAPPSRVFFALTA